MQRRSLPVLAGLLALLGACDKVPLSRIEPTWTVAEAAWFEEEHTLFVFYRVQADQGIEPKSVIELRYTTDDLRVPYMPFSFFPPVHTHEAVDCGLKQRCGSWSVKIDKPPREVGLRLRYHPDGLLASESRIDPYVIAAGHPSSSRSLLVYGVFNQTNNHVQWRGRHHFPNIRNQDATDLGLRRKFRVTEATSGEMLPFGLDNPYWYGGSGCAGTALGWPERETQERAIWEDNELEIRFATHPHVCGVATTTDALGEFSTGAVARKNPEVRSAFPALRTPVAQAAALKFRLEICDHEISAEHHAMQLQRLQHESAPLICIDRWREPNFSGTLATQFQLAIDAARTPGQDMVMTLTLTHEDATGRLAAVVAAALFNVLSQERQRVTPRAVGAFVFDSVPQLVVPPELNPLVLWCPARLGPDLDAPLTQSQQTCLLLREQPDLMLGPFSFNQLPILPSRPQYLNFIKKYSDEQAGKMKSLEFRTPSRTAISDDVQVSDTMWATFFNDERITPAPTDAFSFCDKNSSPIVFRVPQFPDQVGSLSMLGQIHSMFPQPAYQLGLLWESPYLVKLTYEVVVAGSASAFGVSIPFGIHNTTEETWGNQQWYQQRFGLEDALLQCTRFCDMPTFQSSAIYEPLNLFREGYAAICYEPAFPVYEQTVPPNPKREWPDDP